MQRHLDRANAAHATMSNAERFVVATNTKARGRYGIPDQLIALADLPTDDECSYCGATEDMGWDHVEPLGRGGRNAADNLVAACGTCNRSKNGRTPDEWLAAGLYSTWIANRERREVAA